MALRGINYDIGTPFRKGELSRPDFDESIIKKEIEIIRNDLGCDAIRISGYDIHRLLRASEFALEQGLQVWLSPAYIDATPEEAERYLVDCAKEAEELRKKYNDLVFVAGCEYSLFLNGFVKGRTIHERIMKIFSPVGIMLNSLGFRRGMHRRLNVFLRDTVTTIRKHFGGKLTYASGTWERIDWDAFDIVGIDHYLAAYNKSSYTRKLADYYKFNKPVAVLEFGCCTYKGAEDKGGAGWTITEVVDGKRAVKDGYVRDETVQANYIIELLGIFEREKIYGAFVFTFVNPSARYNSNPRFDLDMASYGIVKPVDDTNEASYKGLPWVPKEAFHRLSAYYKVNPS